MVSQPEIPADDDLLEIVDDEPPATAAANAGERSWTVLVVDDDDDVHQSTRFALRGAKILGHPVELLHARSAAEARTVMAGAEDVAVALVDVVMEQPDAGLRLVQDLRESGFSEMRIVLRTGQPGYAPELSVIAAYDIDDYRTKSELTRTRLLTVLTACIRTYDYIRTIMRSRLGLEMIVQSASELVRRTSLELFSRGVLTQIAGILGVSADGMVCVAGPGDKADHEPRVISAAGRLERYLGQRLSGIDESRVQELVQAAQGKSEPVVCDGLMAMHFACESGRELTAVIEAGCELDPPDRDLLKLFSTNIAIAFENLALVERLDRLAFVDQALQVPNSNAFHDVLTGRLATDPESYRVAMVEVDAYTSTVAANGVQVAQGFMAEAYRRLSRDDGKLTVARISDGTFGLIGDRDQLNEKLITAAFDRPFRIGDVEITSAATAALCDLAGAGSDSDEVMRQASSALLHVRRTRRGECVAYDAEMRTDVERRIALQSALKRAISQGEGLAVHMQPKVEMASGDVIGAEALLRWQLGDEAVSPAEFIPIAEAAGLTQELTDFVLETVGRWAQARSAERKLPVAVNLSMADLDNPGFAARLLERAPAAGLSPQSLEFEVTEGIAMKSSPWAIDQARDLKEAGYRIALDDFGTGYSSLGHFDRLPVDTLKIDRSFVTPLETRGARSSLAAVVLAMAEAMEVECVAEGIETVEQRQALDFLGCDVGQGYFFGRPVPIEEFDSRYLPLAAE